MTTRAHNDEFAGAVCRTVGGDLWYSTDKEERAQAVKFCQRCPALKPCRELGETEVFGIWGGRPAGGRRNMDFYLERSLRDDAKRDQTVTFTAPDSALAQAS